MLISVCVCTFKRPCVTGTLTSILAQVLPPGTQTEIIVVDNDSLKSAEAAVDALALGTSVPVKYAVEPVQNIALARNMALSLASGEWIAFIDDDEIADSHWIAGLLAAAETHGADVAIGRVDALYPPATPQWLLEVRPFSRRHGETGTPLTTGISGNALLKHDILLTTGIRFDPSFGRSGGEDSDFFYRLHGAGAKIVSADEAVIVESIPADRLNKAYLRRRALRAGQSYAVIRLRALTPAGRILFFTVSLFKALAFATGSAMFLLVTRAVALKLGIRSWLNFGKSRACIGYALPTMY